MITQSTITTPNGTQTNYAVTREDYRVININRASDLTGKVIEMTIRKSYETPVLVSKTATITNVLSGLATITLDKNNTPINDYASLVPGKYLYDIQEKVIATDGQRNTFQSGEITILDHITTT